MFELDLFMSEQMRTAPEHPLRDNLGLVSGFQHASLREIQARQRSERIPGVVKRIVPLDATTSWEYWWYIPGRLLLSEDAQLLASDRPRVEAILSKLVWLWGGHCFGKETQRDQDQPVYDWQQVLAFVSQQGLTPDLIDIDFFDLAVKPTNQQINSIDTTAPNYVAVEPAHWHIEFFHLQPIDGGFKLQEPKQVCSCQIWTAKPFLKHLETGSTTTRYDLWVARPLDLTNPPWRSSL